MIKAVDKELSEEDLMTIGDSVVAHIQHWDRLATLVRDRSVVAVMILPRSSVLLCSRSSLLRLSPPSIPPLKLTSEWEVGVDMVVICLLTSYRRFFSL